MGIFDSILRRFRKSEDAAKEQSLASALTAPNPTPDWVLQHFLEAARLDRVLMEQRLRSKMPCWVCGRHQSSIRTGQVTNPAASAHLDGFIWLNSLPGILKQCRQTITTTYICDWYEHDRVEVTWKEEWTLSEFRLKLGKNLEESCIYYQPVDIRINELTESGDSDWERDYDRLFSGALNRQNGEFEWELYCGDDVRIPISPPPHTTEEIRESINRLRLFG